MIIGMTKLACLAVLFLLAACGRHPLAGAWAQQVPAGTSAVTLEFETDGSRIMGHCDVGGEHKHINGSYVFDAAQGAVTMTVTDNAALLGTANGGTLAGKVDGEKLEFTAGTTALKFARTDHVPGH
jgi:hypothetical protein